MEIVKSEKINNAQYNITSACEIYFIHIKVDEHEQIIREFINYIQETSWITRLAAVPQAAYKVRADRTIQDIKSKIQAKNTDKITSESGEYIVSYAAQEGLAQVFSHIKVPLAEIIKEKVSGNPGFDFHTESHSNIIVFGESKYKSDGTPHTTAIRQIIDFIRLQKDTSELSDLCNFVSALAGTKTAAGDRGYAAAFTVNAQDKEKAILYPLKDSELMTHFLNKKELYLIGVEV